MSQTQDKALHFGDKVCFHLALPSRDGVHFVLSVVAGIPCAIQVNDTSTCVFR